MTIPVGEHPYAGAGSGDDDLTSFDFFDPGPEDSPTIPDDPGEIIDGVIVDDDEPKVPEIPDPAPREGRKPGRRASKDDGKPRSGPPVLDEWMDFFSRIIIRLGTEWYINHAFHGIDENLLSEREIKSLRMSQEERDRIAKPFAELANKAKITRKHGRSIIALTDSAETLVSLGMWVSRVNRIASKYKPKEGKSRVGSGQDQTAGERRSEGPIIIRGAG